MKRMGKKSEAVIFGLASGLVGVALCIVFLYYGIEEEFGLALLFHMRGPVQAPDDVVVVSVNRESASIMGLPRHIERWPRTIHARLIEKLSSEGASVVVFDMTFDRPGSTEEDTVLAAALRRAGNVVFCELLGREFDRPPGPGTGDSPLLSIERLIPPVPVLASNVAAYAPFPLPKVPVRVNQYWTFKPSAGDTPTLPVVALQIFGLRAYDTLIELIGKYVGYSGTAFPPGAGTPLSEGRVKDMVMGMRDFFLGHPEVADRISECLSGSCGDGIDESDREVLRALIYMYAGPDSRYLNLYGPPQTIRTIPYHEVLEGGEEIDLRGRAVFVGQSEDYHSDQKDGFYTVFTREDGLDVSGVEIAATAFANMLEQESITPLPYWLALLMILSYGMVTGLLSRVFRIAVSTGITVVLTAVYFWAALYCFGAENLWMPVTPLFVHAPLVLFAGVAWKYFDASRDRRIMRDAFRYYLPERVVDRMTDEMGGIGSHDGVVFGICLCTDVAHYTSLSEEMGPAELGDFINRYYETVFDPVKRHGGEVSNVVADSMLAIWVASVPAMEQRRRACLAALDIERAVQQLGRDFPNVTVTTRIGLNCGNLFLGNIGAMDHYEYRPIGDMVNTASRIEGLNKHLGTRIAVSEEVIRGLDGLVTRRLGRFLLYGKSRPVEIHELISRTGDVGEEVVELCSAFEDALERFLAGDWHEVLERLGILLERWPDDGPCRYYMRLAGEYLRHPPAETWDGVVRLEVK